MCKMQIIGTKSKISRKQSVRQNTFDIEIGREKILNFDKIIKNIIK